jgi:hypothetical protein
MTNMKDLNPDTVQFIVDQTKGAVDKQLADVSALDAKIGSIFAIASGVITITGLSAAVGTSVAVGPPGVTTTSTVDPSAAVTGLLVAALFAFGVAAIAMLAGWWVRDFQGADYAQTLWKEHWDESPAQIRHMIAAGVPEIFEHNHALIQQKTKAISVAIVATSIEVICSGAAIVALTI